MIYESDVRGLNIIKNESEGVCTVYPIKRKRIHTRELHTCIRKTSSC